MFIHYKNRIVNSDSISHITCDRLETEGIIHLRLADYSNEVVEGHEAVDIIMRICPNYFEGRRWKYMKAAWVVHNFIGHPFMQVFMWLGLKSTAMKIHDCTIPVPRLKK